MGQINDPLSLNLYTYSHNNPISYYDPTGHSREMNYYMFKEMNLLQVRWMFFYRLYSVQAYGYLTFSLGQ